MTLMEEVKHYLRDRQFSDDEFEQYINQLSQYDFLQLLSDMLVD